ncbi:MAG TPA: hypothetical protein PK413_06665, partial [Thermoanaerobaculia bacterium]|nr:hypothetical protein [Thermoanaerobaculia bacterium]
PALGRLESAISFGVGVSYYDFTLSSFNQFYDLDRFSEVSGRQVGEFYGPPDYTDGNLKFDSLEEGQGDAFAANVGFLWKLGRQQRWSIGGVFRQGATFDTGRDLRTCSPQGGTDEGQVDPRSPIVCDFDTALRAGKFTIPDTFGLGFAFRSAEGKTKIALDLNRVRYSQRLIDFTFGLDPASGLKARDFRIEDADQIHLGVERVVLVVESLFVGTARFGAWREPFHELEYSGGDEATAALIRRAKDAEIHYSAGFGLVIKEDYQLDFAADLADGANTYSFSLVKFF